MFFGNQSAIATGAAMAVKVEEARKHVAHSNCTTVESSSLSDVFEDIQMELEDLRGKGVVTRDPSLKEEHRSVPVGEGVQNLSRIPVSP